MKKKIKKSILSYIGNYIDLSERDIRKRIELNDLKNIWSVREPDSPIILGIIYDRYQLHKHYVKAALELKISFDVIKIHTNEWLENLNKENYDGFIVWPNGMKESLKSLYDSRIKIIIDILKKPVFPNYDSIWLYENKIRSYDWLKANHFPTIPTYIYYSKKEALNHLESHSLPVVIKTNIGASGKGVYIVKNKSDFNLLINKCFKSGLKNLGSPYAESRGYVYIQEFISNLEEWRMVRIGDDFYGHQKMIGDNQKHSGSFLKGWIKPDIEMLNLLYEVTDRGGFRSMNVDLFKSKSGKLYVNELHTVFGQSTENLMIVDGVAGKYILINGEWVFKEGNFVEGHSAKARIKYFTKNLIEI